MEQLLDILKEMNDTIDYESEKALIDGEIIDSLDLMELISEMEEAFDITIEMEDIIPENFNSAEAMWELITRLQDN
ncbi:MAG: acyl carrier protein [Lachnospiraceae bacterium]|nr:acyl carrier protein [Lachnospiraceae bacterium]